MYIAVHIRHCSTHWTDITVDIINYKTQLMYIVVHNVHCSRHCTLQYTLYIAVHIVHCSTHCTLKYTLYIVNCSTHYTLQYIAVNIVHYCTLLYIVKNIEVHFFEIQSVCLTLSYVNFWSPAICLKSCPQLPTIRY